MNNINAATDEQLFNLYLQTRDDAYFTALHDRHAADLHKCVKTKYLGGNADHADDIVQRAFLKLIEESDRYERDKKLRPWLFTLAINLAINFMRDSANRHAHSLHRDQADVRRSESEAVNTRCILIRKAIGTLAEVDRNAVDLVHFQGFNFQKAAKQLGIPLGSFKVRMRRAHRLLRLV